MMFGLMGYTGIPLNMTTSFLTCILVGVGIDYTVHFLWHLRDHIREGDSLDDAIAKTLKISAVATTPNKPVRHNRKHA